jgi:hypothetical protein
MDILRDIGVLSEKEADEVLSLIDGLEVGALSLSSLKSLHDSMIGDAEGSPLVRTLLGCIIEAAEGGGGSGGVGRMVLWAETIDECLENALFDLPPDEAAPRVPTPAMPFARPRFDLRPPEGRD